MLSAAFDARYAAQPPSRDQLPEQARVLVMVANLIGQTVRLSRKVENERHEIEAERDKLRREVRAEHGFDSIVGHTSVMRRVFTQVRQVAKSLMALGVEPGDKVNIMSYSCYR